MQEITKHDPKFLIKEAHPCKFTKVNDMEQNGESQLAKNQNNFREDLERIILQGVGKV